jgi:cell cycle arrest protein BUB2
MAGCIDPYFTYCQGMNTICGPFLYVMPEPDAFFAFSKLVTKKFPLYWVCSHIGVQAGAIV